MLIRLLQRILLMIVTVIATSSAIFVLIHAAGDPTQGFLPPGASPEMRAQVRSSLGLDDPIVVQYARFIGRGLRGDFGNSWRDHQPALQSVLARLPATLLLATTAAGIGVLAGVLSGAGGRWSDGSISLIADVVMAVPFVVIGIVLTAILGQSVSNVLAILIVGGWVGYQRILRLQTRSLIRSEFVQASFQFGASRWHVFRRHLIPNLLPILLLLFFQQIAAMMLFEASLTYLGLGLPVERITLGGMVHDGQEQIFNGWWVSVFPGIAIALAVIGFNLFADWLRERRDPSRHWT